jgi:hypothetical protein
MMMTAITPNAFDVLCGKSRDCLQAEGSRRFRDIIDTHVASYSRCKTKFEKMKMTSIIYEQVRQDARFLKYDSTQTEWVEITCMAARDKVSHALRFAARAKRRNVNNGSNKQRKQTPAGHKRSGSISSTNTSEAIGNSPFTSDPSFVGKVFRSPEMNVVTITRGNEVPEAISSDDSFSSYDSFASDTLDDFLDLERCCATKSDADYRLQLQEEKPVESYPVGNNFWMSDINKVVKKMEVDEDEQSLLSLLTEPMGEWELEGGVQFL